MPGRLTSDILAEALPGIILQIYFPKTMYWTGKGGPRFIRPIRWIVALLGEEIVPFELAGVRSGALTARPSPARRARDRRHHRRLRAAAARPLRDSLRRGAPRQDHATSWSACASSPTTALLETLVYLTEYPDPDHRHLRPQFLELPEEVLITVMRHHQKYFSVEDADGKLAPQFVAVMNIPCRSRGLRPARQRARAARPLQRRALLLGDRSEEDARRPRRRSGATSRSRRSSASIWKRPSACMALVGRTRAATTHAVRAAELLAKCDLTTELVKEFTELQGVVGGLYARAQGEPEPVWQAIYDHYKPESMEDRFRAIAPGQIVALADKLDTLRGCFRVGLIPSGSRDPFALRRAAQGVVKILVEGKLDLDLAPYSRQRRSCASSSQDRIRYYFRDVRGFAYDEVNAVHGGRLEQPGRSRSAPGARADVRAHARFRAARRQLQTHPATS